MLKNILLSTILAGYYINCFACTTIIVGKNASENGHIMFGRNSDTKNPDRAKHLKIYEQSNGSFRFVALPYYDTETKDGMLQVAMNSVGVAITATESITSNDTALKFDPFVTNGISEFDLVKPIIGKAVTAKDGIKILGNLITTKGVSEGFGVAIADKNEVWYLETGSGHHWIAVKIPDDSYFVSANQGRIQKIGLKNGKFTSNYIGSPDVEGFAIKNHFAQYTNNKFDFRKTYQRIINTPSTGLDNDINYNYYRIATLQNKFSNLPIKGFEKGEFPTFVKPTHKLTLTEVKFGLENYYDHTPYNPYLNESTPYRPISVFRASNSHVTIVGNSPYPALATVEYISLGMPSSSVFIPFYIGISNVPPSYQIGNDKADDKSAFWKFRKLQTLVFTDFKNNQPLVRQTFDNFEAETLQKQKVMEAKFKKTHNLKVIQEFTQNTIHQAFDLTDNLTKMLEKHYNDTHTEKLKFTDGDFDKLTAYYYQKYPFHGF